jgi:predicted nucleic acid-binding protein
MELADTSAWTVRHRDPAMRADFDERVARGEIGTCRQVVLELLLTATDTRSFEALENGLDGLRDYPIRRREWERAARVMALLLERGALGHRRVKLPDLLVAAAAESAEVPVLHYDHDFELIAEITGQPTRSLAPLGSL